MGRDWLYKVGSDGSGKSPSTAAEIKRPVTGKTRKEKNNSSSAGCMSAIFNLFDIQNHQFKFYHPSFSVSESTIINNQLSNFGVRGVEPPRNSLESPADVASSSSLKVKEQTNLNIPNNGIQIKTKRSRLTDDISSECSSSPGTKTPNLVARLMGLDILPEYSSPRPSSSTTPVNCHHRSRSLPTTPRMSTASRRSTDNDYHHRLSLQIDKENGYSCSAREHESLQMKMARRRVELLVNRKDHDGTSEYAKQVANQVRERIGRRLGTDITNTVSSRNKEQRRDSNLVLLKQKKSTQPRDVTPVLAPQTVVKEKQHDSKSNSSSPKLSLLDIKSNLNKPNSHLMRQQVKLVKETKIKKITSERYDLRLKKMNNQHDDAMFANKICKKKSTSLSNDVVNVENTTKFLAFKKEMTSPFSTTRLPQKQVSLISMTHLPSSLNSPYNSNDNHTVNKDQRDISHVLPNFVSSSKSHRFKPHGKTAISNQHSNVTITSTEITKSVQSVKCEQLENINRLIEKDVGFSMRGLKVTAFKAEVEEFKAEVEEIVKDIENEIVGSLVNEMVVNDVNGAVNLAFRQGLTK